MMRILTKKNVSKALPSIVALGLGFLLPLLWWPTNKIGVALGLFLPFLLTLAYGVCYLSAIQRRDVYFFLTTVGVLCGIFVAFMVFVLVYRAVCL